MHHCRTIWRLPRPERHRGALQRRASGAVVDLPTASAIRSAFPDQAPENETRRRTAGEAFRPAAKFPVPMHPERHSPTEYRRRMNVAVPVVHTEPLEGFA